jgi:hypothetical protein
LLPLALLLAASCGGPPESESPTESSAEALQIGRPVFRAHPVHALQLTGVVTAPAYVCPAPLWGPGPHGIDGGDATVGVPYEFGVCSAPCSCDLIDGGTSTWLEGGVLKTTFSSPGAYLFGVLIGCPIPNTPCVDQETADLGIWVTCPDGTQNC